MRVGYVGLGLMGKPMAINILKAGFPVSVWNRTASKCDDLVAAGATVCATPAEVAAGSDVVFTNLSDSPDVMEVVFGANGVAAGIREGAIFVDNSTIKPSVAQEIARRLWEEKKVRALDAPVSGGDLGARNGTLTIMVGGDAAALEAVLPVLLAMGKKVTHIGDSGAGQVCKAANQIMVAAQMVALSEILVFTEKCGVPGPTVIEAIRGGSAQCWTLDVKPERLFAGNREPGFKAALQSKDLGIVMDSAKEFGVPLPSTAVNTQLFQAMVQNGDGDRDNSAVVSVLERMANVHISEPKKA
ncbi:2-hydroxy-3-oxopropionate reductase, putative [Leishmania panamensis]|uniref:2-hydroxy-3-oxopropionate reductase, putative n=2 Tax=Leishmania guyanensis species complex TaxID=38579 RepID=A0A088RW69_LEIPA|nr:2-hydroxy-3-oxopropionate reductase, putative [Leishmania panamensis]AIO00254.1 2-hydroxy-3-oxopropionate reductase, putative [Leishmania panamensis]CCM17416.1 2-hydroxy-3-oxopropionate reductase, putative [Leishmania guyanensis]